MSNHDVWSNITCIFPGSILLNTLLHSGFPQTIHLGLLYIWLKGIFALLIKSGVMADEKELCSASLHTTIRCQNLEWPRKLFVYFIYYTYLPNQISADLAKFLNRRKFRCYFITLPVTASYELWAQVNSVQLCATISERHQQSITTNALENAQ